MRPPRWLKPASTVKIPPRQPTDRNDIFVWIKREIAETEAASPPLSLLFPSNNKIWLSFREVIQNFEKKSE